MTFYDRVSTNTRMAASFNRHFLFNDTMNFTTGGRYTTRVFTIRFTLSIDPPEVAQVPQNRCTLGRSIIPRLWVLLPKRRARNSCIVIVSRDSIEATLPERNLDTFQIVEEDTKARLSKTANGYASFFTVQGDFCKEIIAVTYTWRFVYFYARS